MQSPQYPDTAGAVYLSGTEGVQFERCTFKYLAVRTPLEAEPSLPSSGVIQSHSFSCVSPDCGVGEWRLPCWIQPQCLCRLV